MTNEILVSFIIPVYNTAPYLDKCLISVRNQSYKNLQIICVNDASTDDSLAILKKHAEEDERLLIVDKEKNEGLSAARNSGIEIAQGDYITFLDSDDWYDLDYVETMINEILSHDSDAAMSCYVKEFSGHSVVTHIFESDKLVFKGEELREKVLKRLYGLTGSELSKPQNADTLSTTAGRMIRADLCKKHKFVDLKKIGSFEDGLYHIDVFSEIGSIVYIDKPFYHYLKTNPDSLTVTYKKDLFAQWQNLYDLMFKRIEEQNLPESYTLALNNRICLGMIGLGINELLAKESIFKTSKKLSEFLNTERYREAFKNLDFRFFPIHWKVFFLLCKFRLTLPLVFMLKSIEFLRKRIKE